MTKKASIINRIDKLSESEKQKAISFFNKYPVYGNRIDWNSKSLKYSDFEKVFLLANASKNNIKRISK